MKRVDLHVHTLASHCGLHTLLEVLELAAAGGMELIGITDHDEGRGTRTRVLAHRFARRWKGLRILPGMEFSIRDQGRIAVPPRVRVADLEICLAGFHPDSHAAGGDPQALAEELEAALARYPFIDIVSHPTITGFDVDVARAAAAAARCGAALEVNNCSLRYGKESAERLAEMLARCREHGTRVAVNSDAHTAAELGAEEKTRPLLEAAGLAAGQLISASPEHALAFVAERLPNKRAWEPPPT